VSGVDGAGSQHRFIVDERRIEWGWLVDRYRHSGNGARFVVGDPGERTFFTGLLANARGLPNRI
jgi:hypothetical protein